MLSFYQKFFIHINLILLLLLGLACGLLGGAWLEKRIPWETHRVDRSVPQALVKIPKVTSANLDSILQRNLFNSSERSRSATVDLGSDEGRTVNGTAERPSISRSSGRTLLGTVVAGDNSLALMFSEDEFTLYHLDDDLPDGGVIEKIERNLIHVREDDGNLTEVAVADGAGSSTKASSSEKRAERTDRSEHFGIKQFDGNRWLISQRTADEVRQRMSAELRLAQVQPRVTNDKINGFIIRRLKRASILNKLGLKRGDVILNINDIPLDGPESGLQVFQQLREARQINLAVERKGEAMTFAYELN